MARKQRNSVFLDRKTLLVFSCVVTNTLVLIAMSDFKCAQQDVAKRKDHPMAHMDAWFQ
jgi:hypothetical protein